MFVQNLNTDIDDSTHARCYILYADFRFQPYLFLHCHALQSLLTG